VRIGSHSYEVISKIGRGSFGIVWEAVEKGVAAPESGSQPTVALKCCMPESRTGWEAAAFEAQVLQQLSQDLAGTSSAKVHVATYITHKARGPEPGRPGPHGTVNIAMTKVPGRPLDQWLYGFDEHRLKSLAIDDLFDKALPEGQVSSRSLDGAAEAASAMLCQLAPVFSALSGIAYHRDVSTHNLLVDVGPGQELTFALIDFGLAVSSSTWDQEYKARNLAGTPQYFTPAAWMIFAYSHKYVNDHPDQGYLRQYRERLDHFAMGVLCLELFFALWDNTDSDSLAATPGQDSSTGGVTGTPAANSAASAVQEVRKSWRHFYSGAVQFYQQFHRRGPSAFRQMLMSSEAVSQYARAAKVLQKACRACASRFQDRSFSPVLAASADLLDAHGTLSWQQLPELFRPQGHAGRVRVESQMQEPPTGGFKRLSHRRVWSSEGLIGLQQTLAQVDMVQREVSRREENSPTKPSPPRLGHLGLLSPERKPPRSSMPTLGGASWESSESPTASSPKAIESDARCAVS